MARTLRLEAPRHYRKVASELEIFESARLRTCSGQENLYHDTDLDHKESVL